MFEFTIPVGLRVVLFARLLHGIMISSFVGLALEDKAHNERSLILWTGQSYVVTFSSSDK